MNSTIDQSNRIFKTIKDFEKMFPDEFSLCNIKKCGHCSGTGVANKHSLEMCNVCGGIGYKGFERIHGEFVCRACNGSGCQTCQYKGTVDWITHANGKDIMNHRNHRQYL